MTVYPSTVTAPETPLTCFRTKELETFRYSMIEVTLGGSFLAWTLYQEGSAATRFRRDLDATLRPFLTR